MAVIIDMRRRIKVEPRRNRSMCPYCRQDIYNNDNWVYCSCLYSNAHADCIKELSRCNCGLNKPIVMTLNEKVKAGRGISMFNIAYYIILLVISGVLVIEVPVEFCLFSITALMIFKVERKR